MYLRSYEYVFQGLFDEFKTCLLVGVDNVGSKQMQEIRQAMRGQLKVLEPLILRLTCFQATARSSWVKTP